MSRFESKELHSMFLFLTHSSLAFLPSAIFCSTIFLLYQPIHLQFFHHLLQPEPAPRVRMWLSLQRLKGHIGQTTVTLRFCLGTKKTNLPAHKSGRRKTENTLVWLRFDWLENKIARISRKYYIYKKYGVSYAHIFFFSVVYKNSWITQIQAHNKWDMILATNI